MRTWKQGRIGRITFHDNNYYYVKCLKYPLAQIYAYYDERTGLLGKLLYEINLDITVLKKIEPVAQQNIGKEDKSRKWNAIKLYNIQELEALILGYKELT